MSGSSEESEYDAKLIAALLTTSTHEEAAAAAGMSTATLRRNLAMPAFKKAYRAARRQLIETAVGRLQDAASKAVDALVRNLDADKPADQVRAAIAILEHAYRGTELLDISDRLEMVEQALKEGK